MDQNPVVTCYSILLHNAVENRNLNLAEVWLKAGANVDHKTKVRVRHEEWDYDDCCTPIIVAVRKADSEMVELLLKYNPNVNDFKVNGGQLPLVLAAQKRNLDIMETLLAHPGTRVAARDSDDEFALGVASKYGNIDVVELLMDHGGEYAKDDYSEVLCRAARQVFDCSDQTDIIRFVLENGADPNYDSDEFYIPLYPLLLSNCNLDAVRMLIRNGAMAEIPFKMLIRKDGRLEEPMKWLSRDATRTILCLKELQQKKTSNWYLTISNWDSIVSLLWFYYFGPDHDEDPPRIRDTEQLSDREFKIVYKWTIYAVSSLLFVDEGNILLPHLCRVFDPTVALELCNQTGRTPLLLALEMFPCRDEAEQQNATRGTDLLIKWNPDALKVAHPESERIPMTCAIINRVPLRMLQKMVTCKNEEWFTASPKQQDPVTLLPNFLLVASGQNCYSVSDIYSFSRNYLPDMISSLRSPIGARKLRRGIKRSLEQI